jgi:ATP-binding cassette subfamily C protein CydC
MMNELHTLIEWRKRAAPSRRAIVRSVAIGVLASLSSAGLFVGAIGLLTYSAGRPSWRAIAVALVVIEVIAFLRSPLRFYERITTHVLGYAAVSTWRRWLTVRVGEWSATRWRTMATGDVLERALRDTDELQSLWVRGLLPLITAATTVLCGDAALILWFTKAWPLACSIAAIQLAIGIALWCLFPSLIRADRSLRRERGTYVAQLVSIANSAPELALLGARNYLQERTATASLSLDRMESAVRRVRRRLLVVVIAGHVLTIGAIFVTLPALSPTGLVIVTWIAVVCIEQYDAAPSALEALIAVIGAGERLDALSVPKNVATTVCDTNGALSIRWPNGTTTALSPGRRIAIVGPSGTGKTTLLLTLAGLDEVTSPLCIDERSVSDIDEGQLRSVVRYVPADPGLVRGYVRDTLGLGSLVSSKDVASLESLGLHLTLDQRLEALSRGERQRFAIVRALVTEPRLLILDEPTSGLDATDTARVLQLLATKQPAVLIATHDPDVIAWCDDVIDVRDLSV